MSASTFAAVHVVPLLARVVLCAAFVPAGYSKLFDSSPASPAEVERVRAIGWRWSPPRATTGGAEGGGDTGSTGGSGVSEVSAKAAGGAGDAGAAASSDTSGSAAGGASGSASRGSAAGSSGEEPAPRLRGADKLACFIDSAGLPAPRVTAWLVAIIEFVGGGLILLGLFSRLWGLGLAAVMAGAIQMTSLAALKAHPFLYGMEVEAMLKLIAQSSLFVFAFGILLTGPGRVSLDGFLFGRSGGAARPRSTRQGGGSQTS